MPLSLKQTFVLVQRFDFICKLILNDLYRDVWNGKEKRLINTVGAHPCVRPRATARVAPTMKLIGFNVVTGLAPVIKADVCSRPAG